MTDETEYTYILAYARHEPRMEKAGRNSIYYELDFPGRPMKGSVAIPIELPLGSKVDGDRAGVFLPGDEHPTLLRVLIENGTARPAPEKMDYNQHSALFIRRFLGLDDIGPGCS